MSNKNVFIPADIVDELHEIYEREGYVALEPVFSNYVKGETEYLSLDLENARRLIQLADIEMQKAMLRYPHNEEEDPSYNPEHEEKYDDIMLGIYEKTCYYVQSEFGDLNSP